MLFIETGRQQIELAAGGNPNWTAGVNFTTLLEQSPYKPEIEALCREAGFSLRADLNTLTRGADIRADVNAVRWIEETGTDAGRRDLPRQAFVERQVHCNFTPAELVAGVHAIQYRVDTGRRSTRSRRASGNPLSGEGDPPPGAPATIWPWKPAASEPSALRGRGASSAWPAPY